MKAYLRGKTIRLRCKKAYPMAHTHVIIGQVLDETEQYVVVEGRTFHFRRIVDRDRAQIHCGDSMVRIIPWNNIEIMHWISERSDWRQDIDFDAHGNLILKDRVKTVIAAKQDTMEE